MAKNARYQCFLSISIGFYPKGDIVQLDFIPLNGLGFMATPAQLVRLISLTTGLPLATIVDIDRKLVKGNLRTKGGRGFNAAHMTTLDAARMLTAVLASPQANASVDAVERYARTSMDKRRSHAEAFEPTGLDDLASLPARHSFVDALAALISSASTGSLAKLTSTAKDAAAPAIEIFAFTRATRGRMRISNLCNAPTVTVEYAAPTLKAKTPRSEKDAIGDLEQSRRITERTILPIAKLLANESADE